MLGANVVYGCIWLVVIHPKLGIHKMGTKALFKD